MGDGAGATGGGGACGGAAALAACGVWTGGLGTGSFFWTGGCAGGWEVGGVDTGERGVPPLARAAVMALGEVEGLGWPGIMAVPSELIG